ncbi:hypothetical protein [Guangdong red-banded snake torovirus]|uniref:Matrix protein n=1 Tax=Guangdong red-banded snake-Lycodon rufozonatus-torovirus LPSF30546 TaxID=2847099 RepID=A0A2P1GNE8_9NIDO|nr:hypothetical protein [Guangdong red-banded snake torovirus]AVM87349.1 hypothetical protein [Guangdong red-banded snake-Lycodon rufozonatus-torovirus LPSF30546]
MESSVSVLSKSHNWAKDYIRTLVSLDSALQSLAIFLVFQYLLQMQFNFLPRLNSNFIIRKLHNLVHVIHLILIFVLFYSLDSFFAERRTSAQTFTLVIFSVLVIGLILYVLFYVTTSVLMFIRHRSFQLAFAGPRSFILDNRVYPVDCFSPVIVFYKIDANGFTEIRFGEHCLDAIPTKVTYKSLLNSISFTYHSTIPQGRSSVVVFKSNETNNHSI